MKTKQSVAQTKHRFHLVLPDEIFQRVSVVASQNRRSVTQQIVVMLEDGLGEDECHAAMFKDALNQKTEGR